MINVARIVDVFVGEPPEALKKEVESALKENREALTELQDTLKKAETLVGSIAVEGKRSDTKNQ